MKLSTKGRYGIKAMVDIALVYETGERLSVNQLAEKQGVSVAYLEQLIAALKKAKLVRSARGAAGGYTLSRPPEEISVGEVLRALEGTTAILDCVGVDGSGSCSNACSCSARPLWLKLQRKIDDVLNTTTIKDMADDYIVQLERNKE
ncbi:MAG: Rrf2 family transcriptional regulator [Clostridia bacterium]|jgi:Rrf2 family protein|nr:Rrf2 family transcriptional regulator [Clostridia bacterium]